jgi:two-component sensor histidine kinase
MTNAVRHACFDGRAGEIKIKLMRAGTEAFSSVMETD